MSLLAGVDAAAARERGSRVARGNVRAALQMRLGVEAALVDGQLVPGDVEVRDGRDRALRPRAARAARDRGPGLRRPAGERLRRRRLRDAGAAGYARAGEALLETGVTAYLPTLITAPEDDAARRARARSRASRAARESSACTSRGRSSRRAARARTRLDGRRDPDPDVLERLLDAGPVAW